LKTVEIFKGLTPTEIAYVAERMKKRRCARGEVVIRQGDVGEEFFLVASGAAVVTTQQHGEPERELAVLGAGEIFGETALLTDEPRNATVRAVEDTDTFVLSRTDFRAALEYSAGFKDQIRQVYFGRQ
jgi:putative ABC transport system ATP-binding protein